MRFRNDFSFSAICHCLSPPAYQPGNPLPIQPPRQTAAVPPEHLPCCSAVFPTEHASGTQAHPPTCPAKPDTAPAIAAQTADRGWRESAPTLHPPTLYHAAYPEPPPYAPPGSCHPSARACDKTMPDRSTHRRGLSLPQSQPCTLLQRAHYLSGFRQCGRGDSERGPEQTPPAAAQPVQPCRFRHQQSPVHPHKTRQDQRELRRYADQASL